MSSPQEKDDRGNATGKGRSRIIVAVGYCITGIAIATAGVWVFRWPVNALFVMVAVLNLLMARRIVR